MGKNVEGHARDLLQVVVPEISGQADSVRKLNLGLRITKHECEPLGSHVRSSRVVANTSCGSI
jgi:hypothetical protein